MIRSMTGFGRAEADHNGRSLTAELRSVNHRFLEASIRLPKGFQQFENRLRSHLGEKFSRGKINVTVSWKGASEEGGMPTVDLDLAARYHDLLQSLRQRLAFRDPVTLGHLLQLPDIMVWAEPELPEDEAWDSLRTVVDRAAVDLAAMRAAEGTALGNALRERLVRLRAAMKAVKERAPVRVAEAKERLRTRITEILAGEAEVDTDRLLVEAAIQAERMDCTEEVVRLASHLNQFEKLLDDGGAMGRKLNFLTQEMNREANTIGSKAYDAVIAGTVIGIKEEIEILREQVQNIE